MQWIYILKTYKIALIWKESKHKLLGVTRRICYIFSKINCVSDRCYIYYIKANLNWWCNKLHLRKSCQQFPHGIINEGVFIPVHTVHAKLDSVYHVDFASTFVYTDAIWLCSVFNNLEWVTKILLNPPEAQSRPITHSGKQLGPVH